MDISPKTLVKARALRRSQTEAERKLWYHLRDRRLNGFKFQRQKPIPPYIVDFFCSSHSLVVEVDGATHSAAHELRHDEKRSAFLMAKGFRVCRVLNHDVFTSIDNVLETIMRALLQLDQSSSPRP